jgi:hypothetical protein
MVYIEYMKNTAIRLVKDLLIARRNGNIAREQVAYDKLYTFCVKHNFDFSTLIEDVSRYLKRTSIAANMGGLV